MSEGRPRLGEAVVFLAPDGFVVEAGIVAIADSRHVSLEYLCGPAATVTTAYDVRLLRPGDVPAAPGEACCYYADEACDEPDAEPDSRPGVGDGITLIDHDIEREGLIVRVHGHGQVDVDLDGDGLVQDVFLWRPREGGPRPQGMFCAYEDELEVVVEIEDPTDNSER